MRSVKEHLKDPSFGVPPEHVLAGERDPAYVEGAAGGSCGVVVSYWLKVDKQGIIQDCSARIRGRAAAYATTSALCEQSRGLSIIQASKLGLKTLHPSFTELSGEDQERALVAEDGFHHALGRWLLSRMHDLPEGTGANRPAIASSIIESDQPSVIVGMSGGVDSAVALHRMLEESNGEAVGATLRLWIDPKAPDPEAACCSPNSVRRARATCHSFGTGHLSIDLRKSFTHEIVAPFIEGYSVGTTPNPCVRCNGRFRLDELVRLADVVGAHRVATGHYARIVRRSGVALLARGVDSVKDQSYMLAEVEPETADRLVFPLGEDMKTQVKAQAAELGLKQATIKESQEVCFLGGGDYREFLGRSNALGAKGDIVLDKDDDAVIAKAGNSKAKNEASSQFDVITTHDGVARFTPGQRKGLKIAASKPLYVLDVDGETGRVTVGSNPKRLEHSQIYLKSIKWHDPNHPTKVWVQLRYKSRVGAVEATVRSANTDSEIGVEAVLELSEPQRAPAAGQAAVLYDADNVVVGCGTIMRAPQVV